MGISMFEILRPNVTPVVVAFNTGTIYDLSTGDFQRGYDGNWYCRGGLSASITGIMGRGNRFKSSVADSLVAREISIYSLPDQPIEGVIYDTETIKDAGRFERCSDELGLQLAPNQLTIHPGAESELGEAWKEIQAIGEWKEKNRKDLIVETPFVDVVTQKRLRAWLPTPVMIDSITSLMSDREAELIGSSINDKGVNRSAMEDGRIKSILLRHLRPACERYGLHVVVCVTIGNSIQIDPMSHPTKALPFMKAADQPKGSSSKILDLPRNLVQSVSCQSLTMGRNADQSPMYGSGAGGALTDLVEVCLGVHRSKNNCSGNITPMVFSQTHGLRNVLTNYHYLRGQDYYGLTGNPTTHRAAIYPDTSFTRNTFLDKAMADPKLRRAVELLAHYHFLKHNWSLPSEIQPWFQRTPEQLFDAIQKQGSAKTDKILASRSYWSFKEDPEHPYMSIIDVCELLSK